jgi:hypothetical protein
LLALNVDERGRSLWRKELPTVGRREGFYNRPTLERGRTDLAERRVTALLAAQAA